MASCIDLGVHCGRRADGRRKATAILSLGCRREHGIIESSLLFALAGGVLQPRTNAMLAAEKFSRAGYDVAALPDSR